MKLKPAGKATGDVIDACKLFRRLGLGTKIFIRAEDAERIPNELEDYGVVEAYLKTDIKKSGFCRVGDTEISIDKINGERYWRFWVD